MIFLQLILLLNFQIFAETTIQTNNTVASPTKPLKELYAPKNPIFVEDYRRAQNITNDQWLNMSLVEQTNHIHSVHKDLISLHNLDEDFTPGDLTCLVLQGQLRTGAQKKSDIMKQKLEPQTSGPKSRSCTAAQGLSCVGRFMTKDIFERNGLRSKIPEFANINDVGAYESKLASSLNAQLELNLLGLLAKKRDFKSQNKENTLKLFYGHPNSACRDQFAQKIKLCSACMDKSVSEECISKSILSGALSSFCN
jgi:hypothetical protein